MAENTNTTFEPVVFENGGRAFASSRDVATFFGKDHKDVLKAIRGVIALRPDLSRRNFAPSEWVNERGKPNPMYDIDRDGFVLIAMGFTGANALDFKIRYIEAFNRMEAALHVKPRATIPVEGAENFGKETVNTRLRMVITALRIHGPHAAGLLWFELGLPINAGMRRDPLQFEMWADTIVGPAQ